MKHTAMRLAKSGLGVLALLWLMPVPASAQTVVSFSDLPDANFFSGGGQNIGGHYPAFTLGPNVTGLSVSRFRGYNNSAYPPQSGDVAIWDPADPTIAVTFAAAVQTFSIWYTSFDPLTLRAYDQNNNLLGTVAGLPNSDGTVGTPSQISFSNPAIRTVRISGSPGQFTLSLLSYTQAQSGQSIMIQTSPAGLQFSVDNGAAQTAPQTLTLPPGSHSLAVAATQAGAAGTQYVFAGWSDSGAASHTINVGSASATYTATFKTQYQLTLSALPAAGGTVTPATGTFFDAGTVVPVNATANAGFAFNGWTGPVAGAGSASTMATLSAPLSITANFNATQPPSQVTVFSPSQGATGVSTVASLTWGAVTGTTSYSVHFGTSPSPPLVTSTTTTSYSPAMNLSTTYYWSVTAVNSLGSTPSAVWSFTTTSQTTCSFGLSASSASLPATGTSTSETCPNNSGQPNCGVAPETPGSFTVTPSASCGVWTATSSNPGILQITSGASNTSVGTVDFAMLNNTHTAQHSETITVASGASSATYTVTEAGSGDNQVYREVYAVYEQLLGRDPDAGGFAFWTGSGGAGLGQMADSFLTSPEAFNSDFVVMAVYQAVAGAPPTFAQYTAAVASLRAGTQTVTSLFNSLVNGSYSAVNLYQNLLNRAPSTGEISSANQAGLAGSFEQLIGYPNSTTPVNSPNNEFQSTGTYHTTLAADHTNALYVQMIYYVTVGRDPDPSGFTFWLGVANQGGPGLLFEGNAGYGTRIQILGPGTPNQGFIGSPEFQSLFSN